jgi:hypothetical protein
MKNILAPIVEGILGYNDNVIFCNLLYGSSDYTFIFLAIVLIPLIVLSVFYKVIDPILPKRLQWFITVVVSMVLVTIASYLIIMNGSMEICYADPASCTMGNEPIGENFITSFTMGILSLIPAIGFSFILKYISTNNKTNPF